MTKKEKELRGDLAEVESRAAAISAEAETAEQGILEARAEELTGLEARHAEILAGLSAIKAEEKAAEEVRKFPESAEKIEPEKQNMEEKNMYKTDSPEYRDAFYAAIRGQETAEQRAAITTASGIALPSTLETKIVDAIHRDHPILNDVTTYTTGTVLKVNIHKAITAGKAKRVAEATANDEETNVFTSVELVGNDYSKHVNISYAMATMSNEALESYIATELSADIGEAQAKDVFAQIKADVGTASATGPLTFANILAAFGACEGASKLKVYGSSKRIYGELFGMVDKQGQPILRDGVALGAEVKVDSAAGDDVFVVDPSKYVLNVVTPIMVESDRNIVNHTITVAAYSRAQGTLTDTAAAAYIAKAAA